MVGNRTQNTFESASLEENIFIWYPGRDLCNACSTTFESSSSGSARMEDESGACQFFGTLTRGELGALLGSEKPSSHRVGNVNIYPSPSPTTVTFEREDVFLMSLPDRG